MEWTGLVNYWVYVALMMIGLYAVMAKNNLVKKIIGLALFQTGIFIFYISLAVVDGGTAPVVVEGAERYTNPLPHVLILTAIVVSVSTMAVALAIVVNIKRAYGTIESDEILELEHQQEDAADAFHSEPGLAEAPAA
ncbi:cation:proton antiporter subunit C [Planctomycetota bacterium]|nr:cation:proton antiporter subunit C [Planctomycetota bacterium]